MIEMTQKLASFLFALLLSMTMVVSAPAEPVEPEHCADTPTNVAAREPEEFPEICRAAQDAAAFLAEAGLSLPDDLFIMTANGWVGQAENHSLARYDCRTHAIRILSYQVAVADSEGSSIFGVPMTVPLWRSFIVHEISHAAVHPHLSCSLRTLTKTEYIAFTAQFVALPDRERTAILSRYPDLSGFDDPEKVGETYYALDPARFAVNSYLHYLKPDNGAQFVRTLLKNLPSGPLQ